jgi:hypothetical protein
LEYHSADAVLRLAQSITAIVKIVLSMVRSLLAVICKIAFVIAGCEMWNLPTYSQRVAIRGVRAIATALVRHM